MPPSYLFYNLPLPFSSFLPSLDLLAVPQVLGPALIPSSTGAFQKVRASMRWGRSGVVSNEEEDIPVHST